VVEVARFDLTLGCQHGLSEELHLTSELLKVWLGRSVHGNG